MCPYTPCLGDEKYCIGVCACMTCVFYVQCATAEGVRVLVDAEASCLQPAIHHLTLHHMMPRINHTQPFIYNTIQMYLKVCSLPTCLYSMASQYSNVRTSPFNTLLLVN